MHFIRIFGLYAVFTMALGDKDYTFQSSRQIDFGVGFKDSKSVKTVKISTHAI